MLLQVVCTGLCFGWKTVDLSAARRVFGQHGVVASSGDKNCLFDNGTKALGVSISFGEVPSGSVSISNTKKRIDELIEAIVGILDEGECPVLRMSLRGECSSQVHRFGEGPVSCV